MTNTDDMLNQRYPHLLGVLGGMGPLATADFLGKLVRATPAVRDQDHLPVIVCSLPGIPDRTEAIMNDGPSPLAPMRRALRLLYAAGSSRIVIPCNTAHYWFAELQACVPVEILHIVDAVLEELALRSFTHANVAVLATAATLHCRIYEDRLIARGHRIVLPADDEQRVLSDAIRAVKGGQLDSHRDRVNRVVAALVARGADAVVLACTELSLLHAEQSTGAVIDATAALARMCVRYTCSPAALTR